MRYHPFRRGVPLFGTWAFFSPMPGVGFEPTRTLKVQRILSPQRLPFRHPGSLGLPSPGFEPGLVCLRFIRLAGLANRGLDTWPDIYAQTVFPYTKKAFC
jgi:hypothetical protein